MDKTYPEQIGNLTRVDQTVNSVTYTAFEVFDFQSFWTRVQSWGATSVNIIPNSDTESTDVEVFFAPEYALRHYAPWQWAVITICCAGITAIASWPGGLV